MYHSEFYFYHGWHKTLPIGTDRCFLCFCCFATLLDLFIMVGGWDCRFPLFRPESPRWDFGSLPCPFNDFAELELSSYLATSWVFNHRSISIPGKTDTNTSHQPPYESCCWGSSQLWAQIGEPKVGCPWWTDSRQKSISPKMRKLHIEGQRLDWQGWRTSHYSQCVT